MMVTFAGLRAVGDYLRRSGRLPRGLHRALHGPKNEIFSNSPFENDDVLVWLTGLAYIYPVADGAPELVAWIRAQWQGRAREMFGDDGALSVFDLCQQLRAWRGTWQDIQAQLAHFEDPMLDIGIVGDTVNLLDRGKKLKSLERSHVKDVIRNFQISLPLDLRLPSLRARIFLLANATSFYLEIRNGRLYSKCQIEKDETFATCGARLCGRVIQFDKFAIGQMGRWARHVESNDANAGYVFSPEKFVGLKALRHIAQGEEITLNYTTKPIKCFSCCRLAAIFDEQTRLFFCSKNCLLF